MTKSNKLYTWGASPQLIRLNNQARKRTKLAQKFEDTKIETIAENVTGSGGDLNENYHKKCDKTAENDGASSDEMKNRRNAAEATSDMASIPTTSTAISATTIVEEDNNNQNSVGVGAAVTATATNDVEMASTSSGSIADADDVNKGKDNKRYEDTCNDEESTDHLYPMAVDTSDIVGNIVQVCHDHGHSYKRHVYY